MRGTLSILFDADDDPATGETFEGLHGVDLVVELSRRDRMDPSGYGSGMAVREIGPTGTLGPRENAGRRDLVVAPTSSATRFEIRLGRAGSGRGGPADLSGPATRVGLLFMSQGEVVDRTEVAALRLPPLELEDPPLWSEPLDRTGNVRVLVWNVSSERFRDRPERFARVMAAVDPDVLLLDEVYGAVTEAEVQAFLSRQELDAGAPWEFVLGTSGGRQKTVVASRIGIRPEPALQQFPYPEGELDALAERFPEARRLFDLERERGLASVGAWVPVAGRPVLFVPIDLQSAGYDGSFQDELRILQARTLRNSVARALEASDPSAGVVIGGDMNLVGSPTPLDSLVRGLDGGSDLIPVNAYRLTDRSMATWRNDQQPFTPGRLDFVLVSGSTLSPTRAFAFDANELSDELRERLGIDPEDPISTSDHLPLVIDLSLRQEVR
jgi:endonuclease/exonuclease/phosphatase family metal-dependent hydrolase